jgi:magnesium chelatase subunit I
MPITCLENTISSAECRSLKHHEAQIVPRPSDIYASLPSLTGKLELEYEGELRGADTVAREVIRQAIAKVFKRYFDNVPLQSVVQWFELGGALRYSPNSSSQELSQQFKKIQNLLEKTQSLGIKAKDDPSLLAAGGEFILEGLHALKRISRNEELGYHTEHHPSERPEGEPTPMSPRRRPLN